MEGSRGSMSDWLPFGIGFSNKHGNRSDKIVWLLLTVLAQFRRCHCHHHHS